MDTNYIYGRNAVIEALQSGKSIEKIMLAFGNQGSSVSRIFKLAKDNGVACVTYDKGKFTRLEKDIFGPENKNDGNIQKSQGVIALLRPFEVLELDMFLAQDFEEYKNPIVILLDEITDPHNLGAIARSAECAGAIGLIMTERNSAPLSPAAIKASAGALEHIPVVKVGNLVTAIEKLKEVGFWIVGTDGEGTKNYTDPIYNCPVALVIGSEGKGMRPSVVKHCDFLVKIPMIGQINSLNASVSAGVVLFEILRQNREAENASK